VNNGSEEGGVGDACEEGGGFDDCGDTAADLIAVGMVEDDRTDVGGGEYRECGVPIGCWRWICWV
jgi:hypothetical protein